ncbi:MAG: type IX secretion system sortase PorU, partial [Bacteroidota bacterium]|nr:type IX secretion system sortase PorU [Bacteroidota bacterium]
NLEFEEQLTFRSTQNVGLGFISRFELSNGSTSVQIWDVTSSTRPKKISYSSSGNTMYYKAETDTILEFISFTPAKCPSPVISGDGLGVVENQNLHNVSATTDMIIICHSDFLSQALEVKQIHENHDNLNTVVATTYQIYNEFSSGGKDVSALRNYIKMVYDKTGSNLRYVFLFGDGSYKNFGETSEFNPNFIPTYQSSNSFNISGLSTTSDDYFGLLDFDEGELNGYLDIAVGRFPAKNSYEADVFVDKIQTYYSSESFGDWKNIVTLVADDRDKSSDNFTYDSEVLADKIDTAAKFINIKKIYLDAFQQQSSANGQEYPEAVTELNNRINSGTLIVNYLGHGSEVALTSERLVTVHEIQNWNNANRLALFITGTCEFSRFDDAKFNIDATSGGEMVILNENGGAIAMLTTARVSFSGTNLYMNEAFYSYLFSKHAGNYLSIGDAYFMAKNTMSSSNKLFFVLLGNPAIRLNYPKNKIVLTKINEQDISVFSDTLKALEKVKIDGVVNDENDNLKSSFNGEVNLTFYDKKKNFNTLDNDGNGSVGFWSQYNQLFSGRANVING